MDKFAKIVSKKYSLITKILFSGFLFCVLFLGRGFSILNIKIGGFPFFMTEIMLFISLPFIILNRESFLKIQRTFLVPLVLFFIYGIFYLFMGVFEKNIFSLRDIVLCGYILFFPLTLIIFAKDNNLKVFLFILILADVLTIVVGRFYVFGVFPAPAVKTILEKVKTFNFGFTYALTISFLIPFYFLTKKRLIRVFILILVSLNFYMLVIMNVRTLWIAYIALCVFFAAVFKMKFVKLGLNLAVYCLVVCAVLFYSDFRLMKGIHRGDAIIAKANSFSFFIRKAFLPKTPAEKAIIKKAIYDETPSAPVSLPLKDLDKARGTPIISPPVVPLDQFSASLGNIVWRFDIWRQAIDFGLKSPFFGRGFGVYPKYIVWEHIKPPPKSFGVDSGIIPTHNHLVSIFYKMGFLGLFIFLFINFYVLVYGLSYINKINNIFNKCFLIGSLGAFVFWHTMAALFDIIDSPPTSIFLWIIMGFIFSVIAIDKNEKKAD